MFSQPQPIILWYRVYANLTESSIMLDFTFALILYKRMGMGCGYNVKNTYASMYIFSTLDKMFLNEKHVHDWLALTIEEPRSRFRLAGFGPVKIGVTHSH